MQRVASADPPHKSAGRWHRAPLKVEALATKTAGELALQGSGWACAVILGIWSFYLFSQLRDSQKRYETLLERVIAVAEGSKATQEKTAAAMGGLTTALDTTTRAVQDLAREAEGEAREVRHGLANLGTIVTAVHESLKRVLPGRRE